MKRPELSSEATGRVRRSSGLLTISPQVWWLWGVVLAISPPQRTRSPVMFWVCACATVSSGKVPWSVGGIRGAQGASTGSQAGGGEPPRPSGRAGGARRAGRDETRSLLGAGTPAHDLLLRLRVLLRKHPLLGTTRAAALLAADARDLLRARARLATAPCVDLVGQPAAREEAVHGLRPGLLALDDDPARHVPEHHASRHLVDVLPALSARAHEAFLELVLADAERREAGEERVFFLAGDGEHGRRARRYTSAAPDA